ncbi:LamG domain-containing protein [Rubritalea squalenifaciens]|nr:LamG domain-containing protein [Rubritalea squalenifaciens]
MVTPTLLANAPIGKGLKVYWSMDRNGAALSRLDGHLNAEVCNGAHISKKGGVLGGALLLDKSKDQYALVGGSVLDDYSKSHAVSLWLKPASLPEHGSARRDFILESTKTAEPSAVKAYHLSLGFRASKTDPNKVNLELHTYILAQSEDPKVASKAIHQGPFVCDLDRVIFNSWTHVVMCFDSKSLELYVDGALVAHHDLETSGAAVKIGGLVIGGHRAGSGRNFDGLIDEICVWGRALTQLEIQTLYGGGIPDPLVVRP